MSKFNQIRYQNEYNKKKYDRTTIMTPKGKKDLIKAVAASRGISVNELINTVLDQMLEIYTNQGDYS